MPMDDQSVLDHYLFIYFLSILMMPFHWDSINLKLERRKNLISSMLWQNCMFLTQ